MLEENVTPIIGGEREGNSAADDTQIINYYGNVPVGFIGLWYGAIANIPDNWALCNGSNGTPDLRNRFVICAGDTYAVGDTGGATTKDISHTHTISSAGSHDHGAATESSGQNHTHTWSDTSSAPSATTTYGTVEGGPTKGDGTHTHDVSGTTATASAAHSHVINSGGSHDHTGSTGSGGSATQDIMPPYYALAYIMRIA